MISIYLRLFVILALVSTASWLHLPPQYAVSWGAAHGTLAMTTPGDVSKASRAKVIALANGRDARSIR